jgi:hypothetical protein
VQGLKSAQDFELFGGTALAPSGRALKNSKAKAIILKTAVKGDQNGAGAQKRTGF